MMEASKEVLPQSATDSFTVNLPQSATASFNSESKDDLPRSANDSFTGESKDDLPQGATDSFTGASEVDLAQSATDFSNSESKDDFPRSATASSTRHLKDDLPQGAIDSSTGEWEVDFPQSAPDSFDSESKDDLPRSATDFFTGEEEVDLPHSATDFSNSGSKDDLPRSVTNSFTGEWEVDLPQSATDSFTGESNEELPPGATKSFIRELKDDLPQSATDSFTSDDNGLFLEEQSDYVVLDNGIVQVTITKPGGIVTGVKYGGLTNLLEYNNKETNRGYWDMNWSQPGGKDNFYVVSGTIYSLVYKDANRVEVSFLRPYDPVTASGVPLNIDKRFVLLRGSSGFYSYGIYDRPTGWPAFNLNQTRITFKLSNDKFHYMAIADDRQRIMPRAEDLMPDRCEQLAYPEAHILTNPINPALKGEVDDKYQYSMENKELKVHGWVTTAEPVVGFWIITPSFEFRNGGPMKQNLTSHVGPTCLAMFHSAHYAGIELCPSFAAGEAWKKVLGPVFIYLNSAPSAAPASSLWQNAQAQVTTEMTAWPYSWPASTDFSKAAERGSVCGRLLVSDPFQSTSSSPGKNAFLGLATPGETGSWQTESKGYQFWTQAGANGQFCIRNVRAGVYDLYGWVPGVLGDYKFDKGPIRVEPGKAIAMGDMTYKCPRDGPTVWQIGIPDRTATGFFVPDPNPKYVNKLYLNSPQKWRQYGLWDRYTELYPTKNLVYKVGQSDWRTDWFYAHLNRLMSDGSYAATTWEVQFKLTEVRSGSIPYKLRIATASANAAAIQLFVNKIDLAKPLFDTLQYGRDNAVARHGIHGLYKVWTIDVNANLLQVGQNSFFLTQRKATGPFTAVLYDYLRLEAPSGSP